MSVESELDSAFTEVGTQIKGTKTRLGVLETYAALNVVGTARAVFIPNGGTIPGGTPANTIVIEAAP